MSDMSHTTTHVNSDLFAHVLSRPDPGSSRVTHEVDMRCARDNTGNTSHSMMIDGCLPSIGTHQYTIRARAIPLRPACAR